MSKILWRLMLAAGLILVGVLTLLANLNLIDWEPRGWQMLWFAIFGIAGLTFLGVALSSRENWWGYIPGFTLLGLSILVGDVIPGSQSDLGGSIFLGMIGLSFLVIFLTHPENWWAIIPGGSLLTLAAVAGIGSVAGGMAVPAVLFIGLGLTFFLVYTMRTVEGRQKWAIWPASILTIMGLFFLVGAVEVAKYVWPVALILGGGLLVLRSLRSNHM